VAQVGILEARPEPESPETWARDYLTISAISPIGSLVGGLVGNSVPIWGLIVQACLAAAVAHYARRVRQHATPAARVAGPGPRPPQPSTGPQGI
jgi:hypothetical protein